MLPHELYHVSCTREARLRRRRRVDEDPIWCNPTYGLELDSGRRIRRAYTDLAELLMCWVALPGLRYDRRRRIVRDTRNGLASTIDLGGALAGYALGRSAWHGHTLSAADLHRVALGRCVDMYTQAYPRVAPSEAMTRFASAVPDPMPLAVLRTMPLPVQDMPVHERDIYEEF